MGAALSFATVTAEGAKAGETVGPIDVVLCGEVVDDRGRAATSLLSSRAGVSLRIGFHEQRLLVDGEKSSVARLSALLRGKTVRFETTTMGLAELIRSFQAAIAASIDEVECVYLEPQEYRINPACLGESLNPRDFHLTKNAAFQGMHGFAHEFDDNAPAHHVFFLGYEDSRLRQALEQRGEFNRRTYHRYAVIGVPAFEPGWETNVLASHAQIFGRFELRGQSVRYCAANSIGAAYRLLWDMYTSLGEESSVFWVSPLGTKPHTVASALFLLETKGRASSTALYYDHPERAQDRSQAISRWHFVTVRGLARL